MQYRTIEDAKTLAGTRLILTAGVPGPWGEAAKAVFKARQVAYTPGLDHLNAIDIKRLG